MDDDNGGGIGWLIGVIVVVFLVFIAVMATCTIGVAIGGFLSLKNYFVSFAHNVKPRELDESDLEADPA